MSVGRPATSGPGSTVRRYLAVGEGPSVVTSWPQRLSQPSVPCTMRRAPAPTTSSPKRRTPAGALDGDLGGVPLPPVVPLDGHQPVERLGLGRLPGPVEELDGVGLLGGAGGGQEPVDHGPGDQAAEGETGPGADQGTHHGPNRTGTAIGASWVRGSPVIEARAAWESASDGSEGATSGSRGRTRATAAATAAARAHAARRRAASAGTGGRVEERTGGGVHRQDPDRLPGGGDARRAPPGTRRSRPGGPPPPGGRRGPARRRGTPTGRPRGGDRSRGAAPRRRHWRAARRRRRPRWIRDRTVPTGTERASAISS